MAKFTYTLPAVSAGLGEAGGDVASELDKLLGVDIWYDVSAATGPDYAVTKAGDWALAKGFQAARQSLIRRYITNPGEWKTKPDYGAGARLFVKKKDSRTNRELLRSRLRDQTLADKRVARVDTVIVERAGNGLVKFSVAVFLKGQLALSRPMTIFGEID